VILIFYFIAFGFPWTMEMIEPISARLVSAILLSMLELQFRAKQLSQIRNAIFHVTLFAIFLRSHHRVAGQVWLSSDKENQSGYLIARMNVSHCPPRGSSSIPRAWQNVSKYFSPGWSDSANPSWASMAKMANFPTMAPHNPWISRGEAYIQPRTDNC